MSEKVSEIDSLAAAAKGEAIDLLGRPVRDLRISVIDNCNLRCTYCMPLEEYGDQYEFLRSSELLTFDEIERLVRAFSRLGARKVRLTGGEPLMRRGLADLISRLRAVEGVEDIAVTTNGVLLRKHAKALKAAGLTRITLSLDSLDEEIFGQMNGRGLSPSVVLDGLQAAWDAGFTGIKINVVVQRGVNEESIPDLVEYFHGKDCVLRFIEYMDVGTKNHWQLEQTYPSKMIRDQIHARHPLRRVDRNYPGEVASRYEFEDGSGEIGLISSVTEPFCGNCTRARISADGRLYTCLFASTGEDLREMLRSGLSDESILARIADVWLARDDRYSELRASMTDFEKHRHKVEMYQIGG